MLTIQKTEMSNNASGDVIQMLHMRFDLNAKLGRRLAI